MMSIGTIEALAVAAAVVASWGEDCVHRPSAAAKATANAIPIVVRIRIPAMKMLLHVMSPSSIAEMRSIGRALLPAAVGKRSTAAPLGCNSGAKVPD
jgi:hypothetical protein